MAKRTPGPKRAVKATARKRSLNAVPKKEAPRGVPASDHDAKHGLGHFSAAGEVARTGMRKTAAKASGKHRAQTNKRK
jgi:hypothetical protein